MNQDLKPEDRPPTARVRLAMRGRALPLPPFVPLVGGLGVLVGFILGLGLAPKPGPFPTPSPAAIAAASPAPSHAVVAAASPTPTNTPLASLEPTGVIGGDAAVGGTRIDLPPAGGLSLTQALRAMQASGMAASPGDVISARIVRYADVSSSPSASRDRWVWAIVIRGSFTGGCGGRPLGTPAPCPLPATTERIVLDYHTGTALEASFPALP